MKTVNLQTLELLKDFFESQSNIRFKQGLEHLGLFSGQASDFYESSETTYKTVAEKVRQAKEQSIDGQHFQLNRDYCYLSYSGDGRIKTIPKGSILKPKSTHIWVSIDDESLLIGRNVISKNPDWFIPYTPFNQPSI